MKIYGDKISGNCLKVKYTADYLKLPYEWVDIDINKGESRTADFLVRSPQGQVPVLELDDGRTLAQSNAIMRYLASGTVLLPKSDFDAAKVDETMYWEQYSHEPYIAVCRFQMLYAGKSVHEREDWRVERGETALEYMNAHLGTREFWVDTTGLSVADIALLAYTRVAHEGGFDLAKHTHIKRWIAQCETMLGLA